jgi:hypothetical protein
MARPGVRKNGGRTDIDTRVTPVDDGGRGLRTSFALGLNKAEVPGDLRLSVG